MIQTMIKKNLITINLKAVQKCLDARRRENRIAKRM